MDIIVKKSGRSGREYDAISRGWCNLFHFAYRKELGAWLFWLRGVRDPETFEGKEFPMDFFLDACRAKDFMLFGGRLDPEVNILSGRYHLGLRP